jgi:hypothetical protein
MKVFENGITSIKCIWRKPTYKEASEFFGGLHISNISQCKQNENKIRERIREGRYARQLESGVQWPVLENEIYCAFENAWDDGQIIRQGWFRWAAKDLFPQIYPQLDTAKFKFSHSWFRRFLG